MKQNVFIGKFIDQSFRVVESVQARARLEIYWQLHAEVAPWLRTTDVDVETPRLHVDVDVETPRLRINVEVDRQKQQLTA